MRVLIPRATFCTLKFSQNSPKEDATCKPAWFHQSTGSSHCYLVWELLLNMWFFEFITQMWAASLAALKQTEAKEPTLVHHSSEAQAVLRLLRGKAPASLPQIANMPSPPLLLLPLLPPVKMAKDWALGSTKDICIFQSKNSVGPPPTKSLWAKGGREITCSQNAAHPELPVSGDESHANPITGMIADSEIGSIGEGKEAGGTKDWLIEGWGWGWKWACIPLLVSNFYSLDQPLPFAPFKSATREGGNAGEHELKVSTSKFALHCCVYKRIE